MQQEIKERAEEKLAIINELLEKARDYKKIELGIYEPKKDIVASLEAIKKELEQVIINNTELTI